MVGSGWLWLAVVGYVWLVAWLWLWLRLWLCGLGWVGLGLVGWLVHVWSARRLFGCLLAFLFFVVCRFVCQLFVFVCPYYIKIVVCVRMQK